jgi:hypothetical protein
MITKKPSGILKPKKPGRLNAPTQPPLNNVEKRDVIPQCQLIYFDWVTKNLGSSALRGNKFRELSDSTALDISPFIQSVTFSKTLAEPAGSFSITLKNDRDWKEVIKPGSWALLYLSQEGDLNLPPKTAKDPAVVNLENLQTQKSKLRGILYVESVRAAGTTEDGVFDVTYTVSGRDFGVVYEATEVWMNLFALEKSLRHAFLQAFSWANDISVTKVLEVIHNLILGPQQVDILSPDSEFYRLGQQWLLPSALLKALDLHTFRNLPSFFGNLKGILNLAPTEASKPVENPLTHIEGFVWDVLRGLSIPALHELFVELNPKGHPQLTFRPIPFAVNTAGFPTLSKTVMTYYELALSTMFSIQPIDIISFDLTENNHNRFNHFLTVIESQMYSIESNIEALRTPSVAGRTYPHAQLESVARHGLRRKHLH